MSSITLSLPDPAATERLGQTLSDRLRPGDVVALYGSLGAGKTTLARALIQRRARSDSATVEDVPSPTFTLVQVYELPSATLWHFDLYRLESRAEAWELGIEEAFDLGISLIEWPERIEAWLPPDRLCLYLEAPDLVAGRQATLRGLGTWAARLRELRLEIGASNVD